MAVRRELLLLTTLILQCLSQIPPPLLSFELDKKQVPDAYCTLDDPLPVPPLLSCNNCQDRCGKASDVRSYVYCSCDSACVAYRDCCFDFEETCPVEFNKTGELRRNFIYGKTSCLLLEIGSSENGVIGEESPSLVTKTFINACGKTGENCNTTSLKDLLQPNLAIPVVDQQNGVHYVNYECAKCNDVTEVVPYIPKIFCKASVPKFNETDTSYKIGNQATLDYYLRNCEVNYVIPEQYPGRQGCSVSNHGLNKNCPDSCKNERLVDMCVKSYTYDYIGGFPNIFCALCHGRIHNQLRCWPKPEEAFEGSFEPGSFSLSLLFDFNAVEGVTVARKTCAKGQEWFESLKACRQVLCPDDMRIFKNDCVTKTLEFEIKATILFNLTEDLITVKKRLQMDSGMIANKLKHLLNNSLPNEDIMNITISTDQFSNNHLNVSLLFNLQFHDNSNFNIQTDVNNLTAKVLQPFEEELILMLHLSGTSYENAIIQLSNGATIKQVPTHDCSWVLLSDGKFSIINESLIVNASREALTREKYRILQSGALVCIPNIHNNSEMIDITLNVSGALGILTIVLIALSIVCLGIRLVLQFKITYYQSFAGKIHFNMCLSLCLAFLMLILGGVTAQFKVKELCTAFGLLMYLFFLSAFFWMAAVTFDTWLVFRPSASYMKVDNKHRSILKYAVPCWIIPVIMSAIVMGIDFSDIDPRFRPNFGAKICWFNTRYALLCYFGGPVAILTLITAILFIITVVNIRQTLKASKKVSQNTNEASHQVKIYFRLFALMGVSWIFGFVAVFVNHDALWIVFIILNASQGVLIFVSFVLHKPVLKELSKAVEKEPETTETALSSSTLSTSLNVKNTQQTKKSNNYV